MCQSVAEGGRRCASWTRPRFQAALDVLASSSTPRARLDAQVFGINAVAQHAATPSGATEVDDLIAQFEASDDRMASFLRSAKTRAAKINEDYAAREADVATRIAATTSDDRELPATADDHVFLSTTDKAGRVSVKDFGVRVHPKDEWPIHYLDARPARTATLAPETPVHTTQPHVYGEHVIEKGDARAAVITVALQQVPGGQRIWIVDGHHTLVAARRFGLPVKVEVHQAGRGDPIDPPRLYRRDHQPAEHCPHPAT